MQLISGVSNNSPLVTNVTIPGISGISFLGLGNNLLH